MIILANCGFRYSLGPSDVICRHRSGSISAQVMAWCLTVPSHHLNQCWLQIIAIHPSEIQQKMYKICWQKTARIKFLKIVLKDCWLSIHDYFYPFQWECLHNSPVTYQDVPDIWSDWGWCWTQNQCRNPTYTAWYPWPVAVHYYTPCTMKLWGVYRYLFHSVCSYVSPVCSVCSVACLFHGLAANPIPCSSPPNPTVLLHM